MSDQALLFMPDITGFTEFVNQTETSHSGHIVSELLEVLLEANTLDMDLAEVEGDALFMYKVGRIPNYEQLLEQAKKMFVAFHEHLLLYKHKRICDCGACSSASNLSLKFVAHIAPIDFIEVQGKKKPYGPEIVKLHRLLKNDVEGGEYLLMSEEAISELSVPEDAEIQKYSTQYDFGLANYGVCQVGHFKSEVAPYTVTKYRRAETHIFDADVNVNAPLEDVYELASNLAYRTMWNDQLDELKYDKNKMNQAGTMHQCIINNKEVEFETLASDADKKPLVYSERTKSIPFTKAVENYFVFKKKGDSTEVKVSIYANFKPGRGWAKLLLKSPLRKGIGYSLNNLKKLAEERGLEEIYKEQLQQA